MTLLDTPPVQADCQQCGQEISLQAIAKRKSRNPEAFSNKCRDCDAKPVWREGQCKPWKGEVDYDTFQPLKNGKPFMPGLRSCGHKDCVTSSHVWSPDRLNNTVRDTFYATGRLLTFDEVMSAAAAKIEKKRNND